METCLIAKCLGKFNFWWLFFYVSRHFLGAGMRWNFGWKCRSSQQATSCNCCTYGRAEKKQKTNGLFTIAVCLVPWQVQEIIERWASSVTSFNGYPYLFQPYSTTLSAMELRGPETLSTLPNQTTNQPTNQALRGPGAMANAIGVEVVDGANHLLHHLKRGNPKKILEERLEPREVPFHLDEYPPGN